MIVTLRTERVRTLEQVRAIVEGGEAVDFTGPTGVRLRVRAPGAGAIGSRKARKAPP